MDKSHRERKTHDVVGHVKDETYYQDAELMQKGWGETLKCIDKLKDKVLFKKKIAFNDFCFTLFGNCYTSHCIKHFKFYLESKLKMNLKKEKMIYDAWNGIFREWIGKEYNSSENLI